jgi:VanZ family protein
VTRAAVFFKYWLPVALWMALIFSASSDALSSRRTSRIIGPFLRWLILGVSDATVYRVQYTVRKAAHMGEYAVLAVLVWRAARQPRRDEDCPWDWKPAGLALGVSVLYAVTDEWHQMFVPSREGRFGDVIFDAAGAALGLLAARAWHRWRRGG